MAGNQGARRDNNGGGHQQMQQNEVMSAGEKLNTVLRQLTERGDELADVLPADVKLEAFLASVNQALRNNPKLLRCTGASLVDACVKAAYDGLRIDGREAAIVDAEESYKEGNVWKKRTVARYMPMVFGLIKQILQSGAAVAVKAVIVYANEAKSGRFTLLEGTTPGIHHQPFIEGENRGDMIGVYAIATLASGVHKFEWMDRVAVLDVQKESKTDKVWTRWPTEMWKKTVIRRLRKSLAGTSNIRDMEAAAMFPQFDRTTPHPQMASLPAPPRPTRAALTDRAGTESGSPLEFDRSTGEVVEQERDQQQDDRREQRQDMRESANDGQREQQDQREPEVALPEDDIAWTAWGDALEKAINDAKDAAAVDQAWAAAAAIYKHAPRGLKNRLSGAVTDRNADFTLDAAGAAN